MNIIFAIAITTARMHLVLGKVLMLPKAGFNCYGKPKTSNDLPTLHMYSVQNFFFTSRASCVAKSDESNYLRVESGNGPTDTVA